MRTKNIWVVVFFHAIYDIASEFPLIFHKIPAGAVQMIQNQQKSYHPMFKLLHI